MPRSSILSAILIALFLAISVQGAIEFIYTVKERAHVQVRDTQPDTPIERLFGDGASGDADFTALTLTPESGDPIVIPAADGEFDSETKP